MEPRPTFGPQSAALSFEFVAAATSAPEDVTFRAAVDQASEMVVGRPSEIAAVAAQAAVVHSEQVLAAATVLRTLAVITTHSQRLIERLFQEKRVFLFDSDLATSLESLVALIRSLEEDPFVGLTPGFATRHLEANWQISSDLPYETLTITGIPFPSSNVMLDCSREIRSVLSHRQGYLGGALPTACQCLSEWEFFRGSVTYALTNFTLEKIMVKEASDYCKIHVDPISWDLSCLESTGAQEGKPCYFNQNPVRLLCHRNIYLQTLTTVALQATTSIYVSSTYLHYDDPATRYILFDLLPHCIRRRNIKVKVLLDLMTAEGAVVKSVFSPVAGLDKTPTDLESRNDITADSFLDWLPPDAPAFVSGVELPSSPLDFYKRLFFTSETSGSDKYQIQFWCARDKQEGYRVKNHSKCFVVDSQVAIFGGSNLVPTVTAAKHDLDLLVAGHAAVQVAASFQTLWTNATQLEKDNDIHQDAPYESLSQMVGSGEWDDICSVAVIHSSPSSRGDDLILKTVLDAVRQAKHSIMMSFGHCNIPRAVTLLLDEACNRGVRVQIIVNSLYSNDLRTDQRDLFLSVQGLIKNAPDVELYTTDLVAGKQPPFLHGKYVTIDGRWSAVGSWNMWTRSAFFEMELESLIESRAIATKLMQKFEREKESFCVKLSTFEELKPFCPSGCSVCSCFGSFS